MLETTLMKSTKSFKNSVEFQSTIEDCGLATQPIVEFIEEPVVLDLTQGTKKWENNRPMFTIGKYNEKREGVYQGEQYQGVRNIHMGIDIGAPVETSVFAPIDGAVFCITNNNLAYDYGPTLITEHIIFGNIFWVLWGHLSWVSIKDKKVGETFQAGDKLCHIGNEQENGGWPSHLHFQISLRKPEKCDLPGAVSNEDLEEALNIFPDPRILLGPLY